MILDEAPDPRAQRLRPRATRRLACLALLGLAGCTTPPSYQLSWTLVANEGDLDQAPSLDTVRQCSEVGIAKVRVTAISAGVSVSVDEYPCFPGAAVEGPALEPGEYRLEIEGLRKTGSSWPFDAELESEDQRIAYAETTITVSAGEMPSLDFVLRAPPECDDGIDNDADGRVDDRDPACIIDPSNPESADSGVSLFQTTVSFLFADNAVVRPNNLGIDALELAVDGQVLDTINEFELDYSTTPFRLPLIAESLPAGTYEVTLTALDSSGVAMTEPVVSEQALTVPDTQTGFLLEDFVFGSELFLEPIVLPFGFSQQLLHTAGDTLGPGCELGGFVVVEGLSQLIEVEQLAVRVQDKQDESFLDAASLGLYVGFPGSGAITPVDAAEGWVTFECPSGLVQSEALDWGRYTIEVRASIGADVCFASPEALELAPQTGTNAQSIPLERQFVENSSSVPEACYECTQDFPDCGGDKVCDVEQHVCVKEDFTGG